MLLWNLNYVLNKNCNIKGYFVVKKQALNVDIKEVLNIPWKY